jgi:DNA-binding transcriptional LysR family regulator
MVATAIGSMRTIICASPRLLAGAGLPKTPKDLARLPCVTFDMQAPSTSWPMRHSGSSANTDVPIRPRLSVTTAETAVAAAEAGVGVTRVLHYQAADAIARGALRIILPEYESEPLPIHLLHASRGLMPLKMRSFLDFAAPRLRAELASLADRSLQNAREAQ